MAERLLSANYRVVVASRRPETCWNRLFLLNAGAEILSHKEALLRSSIVILAVQRQHYSSLPISELKAKIVIDVSNRNESFQKSHLSNAECLQKILPESYVIKAFNTLSAYTLTDTGGGSREQCVYVCGDSSIAKSRVMELAKNIGLTTKDVGNLKASRELEELPRRLFNEWKCPCKITVILLLLIWIFFFFKFQLCGNIINILNGQSWDWSLFESILLLNSRTTSAVTAIILLSFCYLPGVISGYIQVVRGTKYRPFPKCLDSWLKARKHLGLLALFFGLLHGVLVLCDTRLSASSDKDWRNPTIMALGVLATAVLCIIGLASIPSIGIKFSWREWTFIMSNLGWLSLLLTTAHTLVVTGPHIVDVNDQCYGVISGAQLSLILPVFTILLRVPLELFCRTHLKKIREGYERQQTVSIQVV